MNQHTLAEEISFSGIGLHTGAPVNMVVKPAAINTGIRFKRTDLEGEPEVRAIADYVVSTNRCTTIQYKEAEVHTVEHILSALAGLEVDNALIELDNLEVPIMDGSAGQFVEAIVAVGREEQRANRKVFHLTENLYFKDEEKDAELMIVPSEEFDLTVLVDYASDLHGPQHAHLKGLQDYGSEVAPSRTFCMLRELEFLHSNNLIKGGSLENAIVIADRHVEDAELDRLANLFHQPKVRISDEGILDNNKLRFRNEPARHKLLDVIGDLSLAGIPLCAKFIATKPGHSSNVKFAAQIKKYVQKNRHMIDAPVYDPKLEPVLDINQIEKFLPHKYPFLLIDKIIHLSETEVVSVKNVTVNEPFFQGHFPGNPVMPGVLQVEAMAQTGGVLAMNVMDKEQNYVTYFLSIKEAKFRAKVIPGDTLVFKLELVSPIRRGLCEMKGTAYVGNKLVSEAQLMAQVIRVDS